MCALQYHVRYKTVEAQPVTLAGKPLMAFMAGGDMHLVSADAFHLFFQGEEEDSPVVSQPVVAPLVMSPVPPSAPKKRAAGKDPLRMGRPRKEASAPVEKKLSTCRPEAKGQILGVTPPSVIGAVYLAVKEAPRTTAEVADRVISIFPDASRGAVWGYVLKLVKEGRLEKRDDPETQLTKLFLKAAE